ncbi:MULTISPECIES: DUF488 domain-containing protein [Thermomonosporaceae]|uniref:DUF488 domain-containing protein n=1 Tax=Thermomonosporaceae TaxID=2012 RepID=UPI00255A8641|nr:MULTISPECIES: DUF488 family protein [Thermomonosporaceae]MDL4774076.1 DUF488 family protein [Actinomadura xylanilytica]
MATEKAEVRLGRVYDEPAGADGVRVLVDRVWPRGLSKEKAHLDEWCKQVAPSTELRKWYAHDPERFAEFSRRYRSELRDAERAEALTHLRDLARDRPVTLLTATKDVAISQAAVLAEMIRP